MTQFCEFCKFDSCQAYATITVNGFDFPAISNIDDRILAEYACRNRTRDRANAAELEVHRLRSKLKSVQDTVDRQELPYTEGGCVVCGSSVCQRDSQKGIYLQLNCDLVEKYARECSQRATERRKATEHRFNELIRKVRAVLAE